MLPRFVMSTSGLVAAFALAACAAHDEDSFLEGERPKSLESVPGGRRMRVEGLFEVTAPVVIWADGGLVFESTSSRRDVVFTELRALRGPGLQVKERRIDFQQEDELLQESEAARPSVSTNPAPPAAAGGKKPLHPVRANHVRIRKDGPDRYFVDVVDQDYGEPPFDATVSSLRFEFEVKRP